MFETTGKPQLADASAFEFRVSDLFVPCPTPLLPCLRVPARSRLSIGRFRCWPLYIRATARRVDADSGGSDAVSADHRIAEAVCRIRCLGGVVQNSPDKLIRWIQNAPPLSPKTAMPDLEIPEQQARDIASYLYTLR